jgi:hypothetical protein
MKRDDSWNEAAATTADLTVGQKSAKQVEWLKAMAQLRGYNDRKYQSEGRGGYLIQSSTTACQGAISAISKNVKTTSPRRDQLCHIDNQIRFREGNYATYSALCRLFIEGAEVTPWLEGTVNWTIQGTGGRNSCSFTLNNHNDAFTVTPTNVCAGLNPEGWRIFRKGKQVTAENAPITWNSDESAKYLIYKRKYLKVSPDNPDPSKRGIDKDGMWLYKLEPESPVFDGNDCVRLFVQLAHVSGVTYKVITDRGEKIAANELWVPAFTGFIENYDTVDDRVAGRRTIPVKCYDFRGLLGAMRVRVDANPSPTATAEKTAAAAAATQTWMPPSIQCPGMRQAYTYAEYMTLLGYYKAGLVLTEYVRNQGLIAIKVQQSKGNNLTSGPFQFSTAKETGIISDEVAEETLNVNKSNIVARAAAVAKGLVCAVYDIEQAVQNAYSAGIPRGVFKDGNGFSRIYSRQEPPDSMFVKDPNLAIQKTNLEELNKLVTDLSPGGVLSLVRQAAVPPPWLSAMQNVKDKASYTTFETQITAAFDALNSNSSFKAITQSQLSYSAMLAQAMKKFGVAKPTVDTYVVYFETEWNYFYNNFYLLTIATIVSNYIGSYQAKAALSPESSQAIDNELGYKKPVSLWSYPPTSMASILQVDPSWQAFCNVVTQVLKKLIEALPAKMTAVLDRIDAAIEQANRQVVIVNIWASALQALDAALKITDPDIQGAKRDSDALGRSIMATRNAGAAGTNAVRAGSASTKAELISKDASYTEQNAGMFADISRASGQDAHPLAGLSFEAAVDWLCVTNTMVWRGFRKNIQNYGGKGDELQTWNKTALFGITGRPLTYQEVTDIGRGTYADLEPGSGAFSPLQPFLHILLPKDGTGAMTIVQQHISNNGANSSQFRYETREHLLNEICDVLDYSFYCSPMGDLVFEFPHYNAIPADFGKVFEGAYTLAKEVKSSKISHEHGQIYTAWILQGMDAENMTDKKQDQIQQKKTVIVATSLARRRGANPRYITLKIPGVGAAVNNNPLPNTASPQAQLVAYAYLAIQRDIGKYEAVTIDHPYRPYGLPNRPYWLTHRQRIGLSTSVQYSVDVYKGGTTASTDLGYIRSLFRDGTYRNMAGGWRSPVDYSGIMTGSAPSALQLGTSNTNLASNMGNATGLSESAELLRSATSTGAATDARGKDGFGCGPALRNAWVIAGTNYDDEMSGAFANASQLRITRNEIYAPTPGEKSEAIDLKGTGMTSTETERKDQKKKATPTSASPFKFKNPYEYGMSRGALWSGGTNFGYAYANVLQKNSTDWSLDWHPGVDIDCTGNEWVLAPIPFDLIRTVLHVNLKNKATPISYAVYQASQKKPSEAPFSAGFVGKGYYQDTQGLAIHRKHNGTLPVSASGGAIGLGITGFGWVSLPSELGAGRIRCRLNYMHLSEIVDPSEPKLYYGTEFKTCEAETKLAHPGSSGNASACHLHLNMAIKYQSSGTPTDLAAYEAARKATLEYLRTALLSQITNRDIRGGKVSEQWQIYLRSQGVQNVTDPKVALAFAEKLSADKLKQYLLPPNELDPNNDEDWVAVNPYLFFTAEQLITPLKLCNKPRETQEQIDSAKQICGDTSASFLVTQQRELRACREQAIKMPRGSARDAAQSKCDTIRKAQKEMLAITFKNIGDGSLQARSLDRAMAEKNKQGSASAAKKMGI